MRFEPATTASWRAEEDAFVVSLPPEQCARFSNGLPARRGAYRWEDLPGLEVTVVPSEIKDHDGKTVQIIG